MPEISPLIRLFVSSTFADFTFEREVLQRAVFPRLRALCAAQGCRFQPIDLRWGVSEEAGNEKRTLAICMDEIARCQRLSPDLNFLILLGDRYGSCFLTERIPSDQVARLLPHLAPVERDAFAQAYKEDLNALPSEYVLLPSDGAGDARQAEEPLRAALAQAAQTAGFSEQELLPFVASATHLEIQRGLLDAECDPSAAICALRSFESMPDGSQAAQYMEQDPGRRAQLEALKAAADRRLGGRVWRYDAPGKIAGPRMGQATRARYKALAEQFYALLEPRIQEALALRQSAAQTRDPGAEANRQFAASRASVVVGREEALDTVADYLAGQTPLPLIVTGESGVGKSTLLARAVEDAVHTHPSAVIITRYIGVTPGTSSLADLLSGLRREIAERYGRPMPEPLGELSQHVAAFANQLGAVEAPAERPLFLVVDALDQLNAQPHRVDWLPRTLAPHVRVVLSTLSDRQELVYLRAWLPETPILRLDPLTRAQGADVLRAWLVAEGRHLVSEQENAVLDGFAPASDGRGTPLYLRLAFEQARAWRSFDRVDPLPPTITTLIQTYFSELEDPGRHGRELVASALGDLAAAKHGLAEDEVLDVLSRSAPVREALRQLSSGSPPIKAQRPLPVALWARLAADLERYLTEREADGARLVTFYHRQVREEAEHRYLDGTERTARHADLAAYFRDLLYRLDGSDAGIWNRRKLAELAFQQAGAGPRARVTLETTLTDARFLVGKLTVAGVAATLDDLVLGADDQDIGKIITAVRAGDVVLTQDPEELSNQIAGRVGMVASLHHLPERTTPWLRLRTQSLMALDPAQLHVLQGHTKAVKDCALSADGRLALSASLDETLRLWDTGSGQLLRILEGHTGSILGCALSGDGRLALSASLGEKLDHTLLLWDTSTGQLLRTFDGHTNPVHSCALSADGRLALSASDDHTLRLWDTESGQSVRILEGHTDKVWNCALSADGRLALSASEQVLRLWDTESGRALLTLDGHTSQVVGCALSADGRLALSASEQVLRLWDTESGRALHIFEGHTNMLQRCALSGDGRLALSSSYDLTLRLWNTDSGSMPRKPHGHTGTVFGCALSADGRLALSASNDDSHRLWNTLTGESLRTMEYHAGLMYCCSLSADGRLALSPSRYNSSLLFLWDTTTGQLLRTLEGHYENLTDGVLSCALSADGRLALSASEQVLRLWDTESGQLLRTLEGHTNSVLRSCALNADGRLALSIADGYSSNDTELRLWDTASGQVLRILQGCRGERCALSGDGRLALSTCLHDKLQLWDTTSGKLLHVLLGHSDSVWYCALSGDGRLALSASTDRTLRLWDVATGKEVARWTHDVDLWSCALSVDGQVVAAGDAIGGMHFLDVLGVSLAETLLTSGQAT